MSDFEQMIEECYRRHLRGSMVAVDVGAHFGRHLIPMLESINQDGRVFAFEPLPQGVAFLQGKVQELGYAEKVTIQQLAIGGENTRTQFHVAVDALAYSGLKQRPIDVETRMEVIDVEVRTLDSLLVNVSRIDVVKIDVEGGELGVLQGFTDGLKRFRPVIFFESGAQTFAAYETSGDAIFDLLDGNDYRIWDITGNRLTKREQFLSSVTEQKVWDYVAIPREGEIFSTPRFFGWSGFKKVVFGS